MAAGLGGKPSGVEGPRTSRRRCVSVGGADLSGSLPDKNRPGGMTVVVMVTKMVLKMFELQVLHQLLMLETVNVVIC